MTVLSAQTIRKLELVEPCQDRYKDPAGNSAGLGPCSYDLTCDQRVRLRPGHGALMSTMEKLNLPPNVCAKLHSKSSVMRCGVVVPNGLADPGWRGHLTVFVFNVNQHVAVEFNPGDAFCQVTFEMLDEETKLPYQGKYQDQERGPQAARESTELSETESDDARHTS